MSTIFDMATILKKTRKSALEAFKESDHAQFIASMDQLKKFLDDKDASIAKMAAAYLAEVITHVNPSTPSILGTTDKSVLKKVSFSAEAFNAFSKRQYQSAGLETSGPTR